MKSLVNIEEVVDFFEDIFKDSLKADVARATAKEIDKEVSVRLKDYAKDLEVSTKQLKKVFSYWKEIKNSDGEVDAGDEFELMAMLDSYFRRKSEDDS